jgi:dienelactone hydrolase
MAREMIKKNWLPYSLLIIATLFISTSYAQNTFRTTTKSVIGFLEYLPQGYNGNSNKYPVVIFLHGLGERGPCTTDIAKLKAGISPVERNGPPKYTKAGTQFPFILISPQLKNNYTDWPTAYVNEVIEYCKTYLRIDEKRIYLTGLSLGGGGTWTTSLTYPKLFAAIAPVCGSRNSVPKACILSSENMPVWAFHGDADTTIPVYRTISMVNAINACMPAPKPLAKITIYPGVSHSGCWNNAYKPDHTVHNPNIYDWLLSYVNTSNASNKVPTCNAGSDKIVSVTSLTISGSGSDTDGSIASYQWTKISGPTATLTYANTSKLKLSSLKAGTYIFKLRVTDNKGDGDSDYIKIVKQ